MKQAKAVYAFNSRSENEISFAVGDLIFILEEDTTSGWSKGRTQDYKEGYFPHNYVEIEDSDSDSDEENDKNKSVLKCVAVYDFKALSDTQISFRKGEFINITKKGKDNDWWEGKVSNSTQSGLFPSNYVQLLTSISNDPPISQPASVIDVSANISQPSTSIKENATPQVQASLDESVNPSLQVHKLDGKQSDLSISGLSSVSNDSTLSASSSVKSTPSHAQFSSEYNGGYTPPNAMSPLTISTSFDAATINGNHKDFATLSPISPALAAYSFSSADNARKRLSMHIPSSSPLPLSLGGENTRDFDALCLLYPYLPSSVSQQDVPGTPPSMFSPAKPPSSAGQTALSSIPPSLSMNFPRPQSAPQAFSHLLQSSSPPQPSLASQPSPLAAQQIPLSQQQSTIQPTQLAPPTSSSPKIAASVPKLQTSSSPPTTSPNLSTPDRKDRYSNRDRSASTTGPSSSSSTPAKVQVRTAGSSSKYSSAKSPGRSSPASGSPAGKRKAKLEGSLVLGKKPIATITRTNSDLAALQQDAQVNIDPATTLPDQQQQLTEVEYLKKVLQQEVELRAHLESVVHDAHGKLNAASHYIKDLKAELFQSNMDISQLRVTNRQLSEQLNKYQLVTRVTVATQTERDENIDKIRMLTEQIHELETTTDELNEQIVTLKARSFEQRIPRSPRSPRSPRAQSFETERIVEVRVPHEANVDYTAVKEQFARVRACLLLEKEERARMLAEKVMAEDKLLKTEQHSKNIKRKLLSELQLKSDLNVRNQHMEYQMQKLRDELAGYKQR